MQASFPKFNVIARLKIQCWTCKMGFVTRIYWFSYSPWNIVLFSSYSHLNQLINCGKVHGKLCSRGQRPTIIIRCAKQMDSSMFISKISMKSQKHHDVLMFVINIKVCTNRSKTNRSLGSVWSKMNTFYMGLVFRKVIPRPYLN